MPPIPEGIFTTMEVGLLSWTVHMIVLVVSVKEYVDPMGRFPTIGHRYVLSINLTGSIYPELNQNYFLLSIQTFCGSMWAHMHEKKPLGQWMCIRRAKIISKFTLKWGTT